LRDQVVASGIRVLFVHWYRAIVVRSLHREIAVEKLIAVFKASLFPGQGVIQS
jgi:hypothetical protein